MTLPTTSSLQTCVRVPSTVSLERLTFPFRTRVSVDPSGRLDVLFWIVGINTLVDFTTQGSHSVDTSYGWFLQIRLDWFVSMDWNSNTLHILDLLVRFTVTPYEMFCQEVLRLKSKIFCHTLPVPSTSSNLLWLHQGDPLSLHGREGSVRGTVGVTRLELFSLYSSRKKVLLTL